MLKDTIVKLVDWILKVESEITSFIETPPHEWDDEVLTDFYDSMYLNNVLSRNLMNFSK